MAATVSEVIKQLESFPGDDPLEGYLAEGVTEAVRQHYRKRVTAAYGRNADVPLSGIKVAVVSHPEGLPACLLEKLQDGEWTIVASHHSPVEAETALAQAIVADRQLALTAWRLVHINKRRISIEITADRPEVF